MLGTMELLAEYWQAFAKLETIWNLWKRGAVEPAVALEEIGRVLLDTGTREKAMLAKDAAEATASAADPGGKATR